MVVVLVVVVVALVQALGVDLSWVGTVLGADEDEEEEVVFVTVVRVVVALTLPDDSLCRFFVFSLSCCCFFFASVTAHLTREAPSIPRSLRLSCSCLLLLTAVLTRLDGVIFESFSPVNAYKQLVLVFKLIGSSEGVNIPGLGTLVTLVCSFLPLVGPSLDPALGESLDALSGCVVFVAVVVVVVTVVGTGPVAVDVVVAGVVTVAMEDSAAATRAVVVFDVVVLLSGELVLSEGLCLFLRSGA